MADAFRIAFEQQLMQRKDQALRLAEVIKVKKETKFMNWRRLKDDGNCACCTSVMVDWKRSWLTSGTGILSCCIKCMVVV